MATYAMERDFIAMLDSDPELLEAVRARLLTRELLELPETVRRNAEATNQRLDNADRRADRLEATLQQFMESTNQRLDNADRRADRLETTLQQFMESTNQRLDNADRRADRLETTLNRFMESSNQRADQLEATLRQFMESTNQRFQALENDVGEIKGFFARDIFIRRAALSLPRQTEFDLKHRLVEDDVAAIMRDADTSGIDDDDLDSFEDADAFLLVADSEGAEHYFAVEVSYTVHTNDVSRANRNAYLLENWTGLPSHSAVAGVHLHDAAWRMSQETGATYLRIRPRALRPH